MIDAALLPYQSRLLAPLAQRLHRRGIGADQLTLAGFGIGALGALAIAMGWLGIGLALILLNRVMDGLDGAVARLAGPSHRGAFLDIALDFAFYAMVPLGFALFDPVANALPAAALLAAFIGTGSSFLAFAVLAEKAGVKASNYPTKGIHYLSGLTEGFETIAVFVAMCLWPAAFPILALVFAAACAQTTVLRWWRGWQVFGRAGADLPGPAAFETSTPPTEKEPEPSCP